MKNISSSTLRLTKPQFLYRIINRIIYFFMFDQWIVLLSSRSGYKSLAWTNFKFFTPPPDRIWADPFIWAKDDIYYVFMEELVFSEKRGRIICLTINKEFEILANQVVLERPYHLSYPFVFEHNEKLYMIPESGENNGVELYRCVKFPTRWEFEKKLIDNVYAVDATLVQAYEKWWIFANVKDKKDGSTEKILNLYYADHPLADQWTPHPLNPIVNDIRTARPAGRIFWENGNLIRPSQDGSVRYGFALKFNRIVTINENEYIETCEHSFAPPKWSRINAVHTFNESAGLTAIDAEHLRIKSLNSVFISTAALLQRSALMIASSTKQRIGNLVTGIKLLSGFRPHTFETLLNVIISALDTLALDILALDAFTLAI